MEIDVKWGKRSNNKITCYIENNNDKIPVRTEQTLLS